jgi:uncharacterized integral membrane protein
VPEEEHAVLYLILVIFVLAGGVIAVLAFENFSTLLTELHLVLFGWHAPALSLGGLLLLSCMFGGLLLYVVTLLSAARERRELRRLRKRVAELEAVQQSVQPGVIQQQSTSQLYMPMPGTQPRPQAQGPQYLFPPPGYWRDRNQGR